MELIARDRGVVQLAVVADLVNQTADLVVLLDGLADRVVGDVDAEVLVQRLEHMGAQLGFKVLIAVFRVFEGNVGEFAEEIIVVDDTESRCFCWRCSWKRQVAVQVSVPIWASRKL